MENQNLHVLWRTFAEKTSILVRLQTKIIPKNTLPQILDSTVSTGPKNRGRKLFLCM
jgi:hypothetical protein